MWELENAENAGSSMESSLHSSLWDLIKAQEIVSLLKLEDLQKVLKPVNSATIAGSEKPKFENFLNCSEKFPSLKGEKLSNILNPIEIMNLISRNETS